MGYGGALRACQGVSYRLKNCPTKGDAGQVFHFCFEHFSILMTLSKMTEMTEDKMETMMQQALEAIHPRHYESSSSTAEQSESQVDPPHTEAEAEPEPLQQQHQSEESEESSQPEQQVSTQISNPKSTVA